jgi:hypothetical protein
LSRIRTFLLFATVATLALFIAACGGGGSDSSSEDPQTVLDNATLEGVESGNLDMQVQVKSTGEESGDLNVTLSGPFQAAVSKGELPELALSAKADGTIEGEDVNFAGDLTLLTDRAYIGFNGKEYEVDPTTFGFVKSAFEQAQQQGGEEAGDVTACQEAAAGLEVGEFVDDLKNDGSADVDGTETTKVSGDLDTAGAVDALIKLTEDPACSSQLEAAGPLPLSELESAKAELERSIKTAHVDVYVGDDDIIRKLAAELTVEPKGSGEKVEIDVAVALAEVNETQEIPTPSNAQPLEGLFQELGVNPLELLEGVQSGGLGSLLEGFSGGLGGSDGGESPGGGLGGASGQQEYVECLQEAETAQDLQKCTSLLQ